MLLSHEKWLPKLTKLIEKLEACKVHCEIRVTGSENRFEAKEMVGEAWKEVLGLSDGTETSDTLYLTDSAEIVHGLCRVDLPVLAYLHEENRGKDFSAAKYACEEPGELEPEYLERVYRRFKGMPWNILETKRCLVRESVEEDAEAFLQIYAEPSITKYMETLQESRVGERAYIREYIENMYRYYEFGIWTVVWKESGEVIGRAGFSLREGSTLPELGYVIGVPWQRQGLAKEVCQGILEYAEAELGFEEVQVLIRPGNEASVCLAEQLGFVKQKGIDKFYENYMIFVRSKQ